MDKLNVLLTSGICLLVCVATIVVYTTWFSEDVIEEKIQTVNTSALAEEQRLSNIAINYDTQVINGGSDEMWIRVKVEMPGAKSQSGISLISGNIMEKPTEKQKEKGVWSAGGDGYYYYSKTVNPGEQSNCLFKKDKSEVPEKKSVPLVDSLRLEAEAVQVNWIYDYVKTGKEAFDLFIAGNPLEEVQYLGQEV
ncbi:MAG: hypothetical protein RSD88_06830 [Anaerovoracaceae bacterium]